MRSLIIAGLFLAAWSHGSQAQDVARGQSLSQANCAACHAIGTAGESPHAKAPPFRVLSERFPVDTIDEMLLAKVSPDHPDMPKFTITPRQAADIAAYVASVQPDAHGRQLVELNCSPCHAIGRTGDSPHADAPPFRVLGQRYPIEALEEAFVEGIETGHPDMPAFVATPDQIADIIAYMESIQVD